MILLTVLMAIGLLSSMHFEFEVSADGGKRLTLDFARNRFEPPPAIKPVESAPATPISPTSPTPMKPELKNADKMITAARELIEARSYKSALKYCNEALALEPDNMSAYVERGRVYFYTHRYDEAIVDLDKAIAAGVANAAVAYNARGCVYYDLKEYKKALVDLDEATRLDPNFRRPYENRVLVYKALADIDRAAIKKLK